MPCSGDSPGACRRVEKAAVFPPGESQRRRSLAREGVGVSAGRGAGRQEMCFPRSGASRLDFRSSAVHGPELDAAAANAASAADSGSACEGNEGGSGVVQSKLKGRRNGGGRGGGGAAITSISPS